jgi:tetratricopeptide (TPR) repeat protein
MTWLAAVALLVVAAAQTPAPASASAPSADELFAQGVRLQQAGEITGAIQAYEAALATQPDRFDVRSNLGAAYARLGQYDQAIEQYQAALSRVPEQAQVRFNLALALYKAARIAEAQRELQRVLDQDPANRRVVLLLADCHLQMGNDAAVVSLLVPWEGELENDRAFAYLLGNALLRQNELLRGQRYIDRLFRGGETAEAHLLMGIAHLQRRDSREAIPEFERAIALNATLPTAHALLGRAQLELTRRDEAVVSFQRELEQNPNDFESNLYLGLLLKDENRFDESYEHLTRAGRLRSQDPAVLYGLGALHLAAGREDEAQRALERVTAAAPDYRQAHVLLAVIYYRQQKKDLGDRERAIIEKLTAAQQSREPAANAANAANTAKPVDAASRDKREP